MMNLTKFFYPDPCLVPVSKPEKEILESFFARKAEFERWLRQHPQPKIRFAFYFPTAIYFYYEGSVLFTAFFKNGSLLLPVFQELKMSRANYTSIRSDNWNPFKEIMNCFLHKLEEENKKVLVEKTKSLQEYASLCKEAAPAG